MSDLQTILQGPLGTVGEQRVLRPLVLATGRQNQALLLLKPESFLAGDAAARGVVSVVQAGLDRYGIEVAGIAVLEGSVLERQGTIDRHYQAASVLSRGASRLVGPEDRARVETLCQASGPVLGGHEFLARHPEVSPEDLDGAWFAAGPRKVRSGFYAVPFRDAGLPCLLVNGFYPAQARHFTAPGRTVVAAVLHTDLPWRVLRRDVLGDTYPDRALPGSIRRTLLERKAELGLARVDITANFVHLSAGPFEAAWEIVNFLGGLSEGPARLEDTRLMAHWQGLGGDPAVLEDRVRAGIWHPGGVAQDLFGPTEDLDALSACHLLRRLDQGTVRSLR